MKILWISSDNSIFASFFSSACLLLFCIIIRHLIKQKVKELGRYWSLMMISSLSGLVSLSTQSNEINCLVNVANETHKKIIEWKRYKVALDEKWRSSVPFIAVHFKGYSNNCSSILFLHLRQLSHSHTFSIYFFYFFLWFRLLARLFDCLRFYLKPS